LASTLNHAVSWNGFDEDDLYQELQEIRRFKPATVSRRFSVTAGFYRTCVLDGLLQAAAP